MRRSLDGRLSGGLNANRLRRSRLRRIEEQHHFFTEKMKLTHHRYRYRSGNIVQYLGTRFALACILVQ